jgi:hypothetical protein
MSLTLTANTYSQEYGKAVPDYSENVFAKKKRIINAPGR